MKYIKGFSMFESVINWFNSFETLFLFMLITGIIGYLFYKHNFNKKYYSLSAGYDYFINILLFSFYGTILFWVSDYVLNMDIVYTAMFTILFYSVSIFSLTLILLFLRRRKLKQFCIDTIITFNNLKINRDKYLKLKDKDQELYSVYMDHFPELQKVIYLAVDAEHEYTRQLLKDINEQKIINIIPYKNINIFENVNKNANKHF